MIKTTNLTKTFRTEEIETLALNVYDGGLGYSGPANLAHTVVDSSSTRFSFLLSNISISGDGSFTLAKRLTVYPTGRIFSSYVLSSITDAFHMDSPRLDFMGKYDGGLSNRVWGNTYAQNNARTGRLGGSPEYHSFAGAVLTIRSNGTTTSAAAGMVSSAGVASSIATEMPPLLWKTSRVVDKARVINTSTLSQSSLWACVRLTSDSL
jgi:hypothetical protein